MVRSDTTTPLIALALFNAVGIGPINQRAMTRCIDTARRIEGGGGGEREVGLFSRPYQN